MKDTKKLVLQSHKLLRIVSDNLLHIFIETRSDEFVSEKNSLQKHTENISNWIKGVVSSDSDKTPV